MHTSSKIFVTTAVSMLSGASGCAAHAPPPLHVRYAELEHGPRAHEGQPVIVELDPGDRIPVALRFSDDAFELDPAAPKLDLVARRRCFILVGSDRIKTSLTGNDFDERPKTPGHFRVELQLTREQRGLVVEVTTPRHARQ
ncbi:MAG TPA: hypothetical protein VHU80_12305 [Polyangiaceae bacterium]|jgi:hypothetical protein|nr:hypothetical protein [Polyangiaceae bacterium]